MSNIICHFSTYSIKNNFLLFFKKNNILTMKLSNHKQRRLNMFLIVKKEATNYLNVVNVTANTKIPSAKKYDYVEKLITHLFQSYFNVSPFSDVASLAAAWRVSHDSKSWAVSIKCTPEYEWLEKLSKNAPILVGIINIFSNSSTETWWCTYSILEKNSLFIKF